MTGAINSPLRFNPTPTFLGLTFDRTLSFSEHVSSLNVKFTLVSRPYAVSLLPLLLYGAPIRSPSFFCIKPSSALSHLCFTLIVSFLKRYQYRQIGTPLPSGQSHHLPLPPSSPIPFLLTEASLPPLRVTLTHFALSSYERALRLPTSFLISGLARLGVKPRLCRSSWRAFASTHPLTLSSTSPRKILLVCHFSRPWNLPSFTVESTLSSSRFRSDSSLSRQGAALAHLDSLSLSHLTTWCFGQTALFLFLFAKATPSGVLANCSLCGTEVTFYFSAGPVCSSSSAEACAILQALRWSRQHQQVCHFSSPTI